MIDKKKMNSLKTKEGMTQKAELIYKSFVKDAMKRLNIEYKEAPSQKPVDFQITKYNGQDVSIKLELKKSDHNTIKLNDTYPTFDCHYVIFSTNDNAIYYTTGQTLRANVPSSFDIQRVKELLKKCVEDMDLGMITSSPRLNLDIRKFKQKLRHFRYPLVSEVNHHLLS